jgi:DNA-binding PadR family transcriptional regulator
MSHVSFAATRMRSPVNWALLGLVIERPSYGYDLAQRFEQAYGDVLPISGVSHIYAALHALKSRSLIEELPTADVPQVEVGRQPTPHYRATVLGARAYRESLIAQRREDDRRCQLFARQLAVFYREPDAALDVLARYEQACLQEASEMHTNSAGRRERRADRWAGLRGEPPDAACPALLASVRSLRVSGSRRAFHIGEGVKRTPTLPVSDAIPKSKRLATNDRRRQRR